MKNYLLSGCVFLSFSAYAWNVTTEPTHTNAVIEEFTGIHCPNCPGGHKIAAELMTLNPEEVYTVAVHAGAFALPHISAEPNYITMIGLAIHDYFGINSYPTGIVNRLPVLDDNMQVGRNQWGSACREVFRKLSPVNLWAHSSYDPSTRIVTVEIEGYYTDDVTDPRMNVFMLQSEVVGPQSGGGLGNEYHHRHMLRARLTDSDFGDKIEAKSKGEYFSRTISYELPEQIEQIPIDPVNSEFLVFVTDGKENILQACATRPDTSALPQQLIVDTTAPLLPVETNYALNYLEVWIHNYGGIEVTDCDFDVTLNKYSRNVKWEGSIPAHSSKLVRLPLDEPWKDARDLENNEYSMRLLKANGTSVECAAIQGKFNELYVYPTDLTVKIKTDLEAADNTWRIIDEDGNIVKEFGPYPDGIAEEYIENVSLEDGKVYGLEIYDRWGDGICHPAGAIRFYDGDRIVKQIREIRGYGFRQFFRADSSAGVEPVSDREEISVRYFDLSGRECIDPEKGVYVVRRTFSDGSVRIFKSIID